MKIGELFAGYGGLGMGVQAAIGGEVVWFSEFDEAPAKVLAARWPGVPNHGDITQIDWSTVEPVDILTGGFPCQDVSLAGARRGLREGTRSGLWSEFARAIDALHPQLVVIENVRGLLSAEATGSVESDPWAVGDTDSRPTLRALGAVLGDLADLGYDAEWCGLRAADVGAPHGRFRVFIVAHRQGHEQREPAVRGIRPESGFGASADAHDGDRQRRERTAGRLALRGTASAGDRNAAPQDADLPASRQRRQPASVETEGRGPRSDTRRRGGASAANSGSHESERRGKPHDVGGAATSREGDSEKRERLRDAARNRRAKARWGEYAAAVQRWEAITGRKAPAATLADGKDGQHRLSSRFVEWMMGLPAGHVTRAGLTRRQELKALGNGVVPQQAEAALRALLEREVAA